MMSMGIVELSVLCFGGIIGVGLPVSVLVALYFIYNKLEDIESVLERNKNNDAS